METTIEKTNIKKLNLKPIKEFFKKEVEKQKFLKSERKNGTTMHPSEAQSRVYWNAKELRVFYAAYALLRGKKLSQVEQSYTGDITYFEKHGENHFFDLHMGKIEKTLEGFKSMSEIK